MATKRTSTKKMHKVRAVQFIHRPEDVSFEGLNELNEELDDGWKVVSISPMGVSGGGNTRGVIGAALVVLEK